MTPHEHGESLAIALHAKARFGADPSGRWAVTRPRVGKVPPYYDSNVKRVWQGVDPEIRRFLSCVAQHESHHNPKAQNPSSSASGKYQFLDSTWRGNAHWTRLGNEYVARSFRRAVDAPAWVQEAVALHSVMQGGWLNWKGTHCGHGT